jgi:threonine/homoserine/homoserine lactone efflux protein
MSAAVLLLFLATAALAIATPGPTVLLALANGASFGVRRAAYGMLGALLADLVFIAAVSLGLGAVFAASATAFAVVKWLGVAYLLYLGVRLLRAGAASPPAAPAPARPAVPARFALCARCFAVAITNPKQLLFFSAILPQFVAPGAPQVPQYVALALAIAAVDGLVMLAYAAGGARAARLLRTPRALRWLNRACGGALIALAGSLAAYRRAQ